MGCKVCRGLSNIEADGRCRGCRMAKAATDSKTSYGKLEGRLWMLYGDQLVNASSSVLPCPICGNLFLARTANQKYCSNACAVKAAQAAYRKRKRTQASRAPVDERKEPVCSSSEEFTAGPSTPSPSTQGAADTTATPNAKAKTG